MYMCFFLLSCAGPQLTVDAVSEPDPPVAGEEVTTTLHLTWSDGTAVEGADVVVTPWMPAHGHGLSGDVDVVEDAGTYSTTFTYSMAGTWELQVTAEQDGLSEEGVAEVEVQ